MHLVRCFTVSPPAISNFFEGGFLWCFVGVVCFVWGLVFVVWFFGLCFPHGSEITTVVCEVVCEVEGPSELSWRARHGRKKKEKKEEKKYWNSSPAVRPSSGVLLIGAPHFSFCAQSLPSRFCVWLTSDQLCFTPAFPSLVVLCRLPGCASLSTLDDLSERTLRWL